MRLATDTRLLVATKGRMRGIEVITIRPHPPGSDLPPAVALAGVPNLKIVYSYDPATGNWTRYIPGAPAYVNNLLSLKKGSAYWFIATGSAQISFQP